MLLGRPCSCPTSTVAQSRSPGAARIAQQGRGWRQQRRHGFARPAAPHASCAAMRQRGLALLRQAVEGRLLPAVPPAAGSWRRPPCIAASALNGDGGGTTSGPLPTFRSASSSAAGLVDEAAVVEAAIDAAARPAWGFAERKQLREGLQASLAPLMAHLGGDPAGLWRVQSERQLLDTLGVSLADLKAALKQHGASAAAVQWLAALAAQRQAATIGGAGPGPGAVPGQQPAQAAASSPAAAAQRPPEQQHAQPPRGALQQQGWDKPEWLRKKQEEQAAAEQRYQQQHAESQPGEASRPGDRQQQGQQQGQGQDPGQRGPGPRASIRDLLNARRIRPPAYSAGSYNHLLCPECQGGSKGEKSLSVTIADDGEAAVWNCFRAKCGWTGKVDTRQGTSQAYRQYTNTSGFAVTSMRKRKEESPQRPNPRFDAELSPEVLAFFEARGISAATLARNRVAQETLSDGSKAIAFPYYRDGQLVNIKYRALGEKKFWQVKGAEKVLFGLDDVVGRGRDPVFPGGLVAASDIVVVEGEMDKLALEEAGFTNVLSVPDGAPARVREGEVPPADQDTKFSYLWACRAWLDQASRIIIATDNDAPGDALAEELARRLGRERCWRVRWPLNEEDHLFAAEGVGVEYARHEEAGADAEAAAGGEAAGEAAADAAAAGGEAAGSAAADAAGSSEAGASAAEGGPAEALQLRVQPAYYRKDANEVLVKDGPDMLRAFLESAEPFPIRGLLRFHEYYDDIMQHYRLEHRDGQGRSTGWPSLDLFYKVVPGELTIVTGVPNSGKSEWIDALLANLAAMHDWCFALCSMEKKATDHARQLVEKYVGKPFFDLPYARGVRRMSERELDEGLDWIDDRFHLVRYEDDALPAVDWVLDVARAAVYRYGIRGLVIDPYNELDHQRPASMNETEYVSQMLTKVKRFAQTTGVHVWFVAHPRQLREWRGQPPNLYDISGSAHFINKADNGIVVHRDRDPDSPNTNQVQILVRKVRNKAAGTIGECVLEYERVNGRYIDPDSPAAAPRTAQRVDFAELARQEELARVRAEQAANAASTAGAATAAATAATAPLQAPPAAPPPAAPMESRSVAVGGMRSFGTAAVAGGSSATSSGASSAPAARQQPASAPGQRPASTAEQEMRRLMARDLEAEAAPPPLVVHRDGTVSSNPQQDDADVGRWMDTLP